MRCVTVANAVLSEAENISICLLGELARAHPRSICHAGYSVGIMMVSDEIEQMRDAGKTDEDIVAVVAEATGHRLDPADIERHYVAPEDRHGGDED